MPSPHRIEKAYPLVLRCRGDSVELLVFDHPLTPPQLPKGTLKPEEAPLVAARRELAEETGLAGLDLLADLGTLDVDAQPSESGPAARGEPQRWHLFMFRAPPDAPDRWRHCPGGGGEEDHLVFVCRWCPLDAAADELHPHFRPAVAAIRAWRNADEPRDLPGLRT